MLIEREIENAVVSAFSALVPSASVIGSRSAHAEGDSAAVFVSVSAGVRQHDEFTLPTVNVSFRVNIETRLDSDTDGSVHDSSVDALVSKLDEWHRNESTMTTALSISGRFFAAGLRMDGGDGKNIDLDSGIVSDQIQFTIRGTVLASN